MRTSCVTLKRLPTWCVLQMPECCGFFGRLFGHRFREYTVSTTSPTMEQMCGLRALINGYWSPSEVAEAVEVLVARECIIRCARCGAREEELRPQT